MDTDMETDMDTARGTARGTRTATAAGPAQEEEEIEETEERVRPIATTPPRRAWREESLSSSSSGTQESGSSGISLGTAIHGMSLGTAIPQETAAARGMEPWFPLPAEVDSSCSSAALGTKLGLSCDRTELSEFPTLEEGLLPSAEASGAPASLLDVQESRFSPCLPLLLSSTRVLQDQSLLQGSQLDFIPLRGIPDVSGASLDPSHIHGAASPELCTSSQHSHPPGHPDPGAASQIPCSAELLGSEEGIGGCGTEQEVPQSRGDAAIPTPEMLENGLELGISLPKQPWSTAGKDGFSCHGRDGSAAGLGLSEEDKECPGQEEFSSSGNSSYTTALTKISEKSERGTQEEKVKMLRSEAGVLEKQEKGKKVPELDVSDNFCDGLRKGCSGNSGAQGVLSAVNSEPAQGGLEERRVELNGSESLKLMAVPEELQGASSLNHQLEQPAGRCGEEEFVPAVTGTRDCPPSQPEGTAREAPLCPEDSPEPAEPAGSRDELTASDFSIERGHKVTEISPSFSLGGEGSFSVHLAHPNFQSTPGIFLKKTTKAEEPGVLVIPSDLQASPGSSEETSENSPACPPGSLGKQHPPQSAPTENCEHFESLGLKSPQPGRIQSFPSLSFMEKVGAWDVSQPEKVPDAVSSAVPGGFSPGRRASSALARASSDILSEQKSSRDPKDCAVPPSRHTAALGSLHFPPKSFLPAPALSRSQSDNAVNVSSRSRSWAGVIPAANSTGALQPAGEHSPVLGGFGSTSGSTTKMILPGSHGEDVENTRRSSAPDVFVSSTAQLLSKDGNSKTDQHKDCDAQGNQSLSLNIPTGCEIMDNFGAISLESLNFPVGSEEPQGALGSAGSSLLVSRDCPSAGGDSSSPPGAALETPKKQELNIEERIPIYLRNLGIQQSPGTILAPFVPRGSIQELELSPSELRTLKDSLDTLPRLPAQAQGELLPAFEMSQSSFNISTLSISIPLGSEGASDLLSPRDLSPTFPRLLGDVPVSQGSVPDPQLEVAAASSTPWDAEYSTGAKLDPPSCSWGRESPWIAGRSDPESSRSSLQSWAAGLLSGVRDGRELHRASQSCSEGQEGHSSLGSGALQELRELLARAEDLAASLSHPASPTASCREPGEASPGLSGMEDDPKDPGLPGKEDDPKDPRLPGKEDDPKDPRLEKDRTPQLPKRLSWDETTTRRGVRGKGLGNPLGSDSCPLGWANPLAVSLQRREGMMGVSQELRTGKSAGRSEPEGCSSVTTDRNQAAPAHSSASSDLSTATAPELDSPPPLEPLGSVPAVLGGSWSSLSHAGVAGRAGGTRGSDDSSSGDSLSAQVRNLLGKPRGSQQPGSARGTLQSKLPAAGAAGILAGSSSSSSGDSLAARVQSLLRSASPGVDANRILRSAEEQERKIRAWVKLKLSQGSGPDWDEETQRRIKEIKAELLPKSRKSAPAKDPWLCGLEATCEYLRKQKQHPERFQAPRLPRDRHSQLSRTRDLFQPSSRQLPRADPSACSLLQDSQLKPWRAAELQDSQLKPWRAAELQDSQLKPWSAAELQLKPCSGAERQDMQVKPWNHAELQMKPSSAAELQENQLKPWNHAELQDMQVKPWSGAELQDMQLKPCSGAELHVCSQQAAVDNPSAVAELSSPPGWDPRAGSCSAAPPAHPELPAVGQQSSAITLCPPRHPRGSLARSCSLPGDGLGDIVPGGRLGDILPREGGSASSQPWEASQSSPPSPVLPASGDFGAGGAAGSPPVPAGAPQETACAAQDPGSIHGGKRQTLSARQSEFLAGTEGDRQSDTAREIHGSTGISQEINPFSEPHCPSSSQQEEIPAGHPQFSESSEGSAAQMDLLKSPSEVLAEGRKSPAEPPLVPREAVREQMDPSHPVPAAEVLSSTPDTPSSPVRKFLSCVHITLSSRLRSSELCSTRNAETGEKSWDKPQVKAQAVTPAGVPEFPRAELVPEVPVASADPSRATAQSWECSSSALPAPPGRRQKDAATQITTERLEKTTFSAEICVDPQLGGNAAQQSSLPKAAEPPNITISSHKEIPPFPRQPAQPLLLPYKPQGSTGMYYVPYQRAGATLSPGESEASRDTSSSGSEDAAPPGLLAHLLALRSAAQDKGETHRHRAWPEEHRVPLLHPSERRDHSKCVKSSHSIPKPAQLYLPSPMPTSESCCQDSREFSRAGHCSPSSGGARGHQWGSCVPHSRAGQFFPLPAEADDSRNEELSARASFGSEARGNAAAKDPLPRGQAAQLEENVGRTAWLRNPSRGSLDELWVKFLERQRRQQQLGSSGEMSLVERLDRLARVLQNPVRHTLLPAQPGSDGSEGRIPGKEPTGMPETARGGSSVEPKGTLVGQKPRVIHEHSSLELEGTRVGQRPRVIREQNSLEQLRDSRPGDIQHRDGAGEEQQSLGAPSDSSWGTQQSGDPSSASSSGWDTVTPLEMSPASEGSSSLSTIDTARLLRAFGQHRVTTKVSPRLAQLYRAISHQKSRLERWDEESSRAGAGKWKCPQGAAGCPQGAAERARTGQEHQHSTPFSDSSSASSSSWGPSAALSSKRRTRMLDKGVQAGDLEIVSSATKRNTRDVGVTFPTPRCSQQLQESPEGWQGGHGGTVGTAGQAAAWQQHRAQQGRIPLEKRTKRSRLHFQQGTAWLIQAEDLRSESRKENQGKKDGPGPSWFEPWSSSKPWREPLREKNWEEQQQSRAQGAAAARGAGRGQEEPLVKLTLQEALALHRPDFISRSGQRLRHLRLLREQRRLQRLLQSQREQLQSQQEQLLQSQQEQLLQSQREQRKQSHSSANHLVTDRGFLMKEKRRAAIPKSEMVQRSKRMYEQLPEVRKKREEEQRKLEYGSYRLRAQLYKTKITNRVLGKKVSWK